MEEPDGGAADGFDVVLREVLLLFPALGLVGPEDASGDGDDGGEAAGVGFRDLPGAVAAEREAGEVETLGVAVKLLDLGVEGSHGHGHDGRIGPVVMGVGILGHDDDEGPAFGMGADGVREADLGFVHTVGAALAGAMEEEDDGPGLMGVPAFGDVDLVLVGGAVHGDGAIEEAGVLRVSCGVGG